ncbi:MAG: hypothetical protein L3K06_05950, partial [Thermoplasmata archaeon]|nr:hypothetical protein [Thermoplasmata archaeon]
MIHAKEDTAATALRIDEALQQRLAEILAGERPGNLSGTGTPVQLPEGDGAALGRRIGGTAVVSEEERIEVPRDPNTATAGRRPRLLTEST